MALGYVDEFGVHIPSYGQIRDYLENQYKAIFGEDIYIEPDSKDGQWISVQAQAIFDCYLMALQVYNSFSPVTAIGVGLDNNVALNGIFRKESSFSVVDVTLTGAPRTLVNNGKVRDTAGQVWLLPTNVMIGNSGEITVSATAVEEGQVFAPAGSINTIVTPFRGWRSVTNVNAASPGMPLEDDFTLRRRQQLSVALQARSTVQTIVANLLNLEGVTYCHIWENDTNVVDANGVNPHTIMTVVDGGDSLGIAQIIYRLKTPGTGTQGDTSVTVTDRYGIKSDMQFQRPIREEFWVNIQLQPLANYTDVMQGIVQEAVVAYLDSLELGAEILISRLIKVITLCDDVGTTFDIAPANIQISNDGITFVDGATQPVWALSFIGITYVPVENVVVTAL